MFEDSEKFDLSKYAGKKVVIAFKYQQGETTSWPTWEVDSLQILGTGTLSYDPVTVTTLALPKSPVVTVPVLYNKVFKKTALTDFSVETIGLATNGWNTYTVPKALEPCCLKVAGSGLISWLANTSF